MKPKVMRNRHTEAASPCPRDPKVGSTIRSRMYIVRVFVGDAASVCLFLITFGFIIASQSLQRKAEDS